MFRIPTSERPNWKRQAEEFGFGFHTMYGEPYWDESAYYQFSLQQVEHDIEDPTEEIHQMCLEVVDRVVTDEKWLKAFQIPPSAWGAVAESWRRKDPSLYSRLDLAYNGHGPAKFLENNADTPTSLFETGLWQWLWLEDKVKSGSVPRRSDQFNSLQDKLVIRFSELKQRFNMHHIHMSAVEDAIEDRGTVQYLQDCAEEAGITTQFIDIAHIGLAEGPIFTDQHDLPIDTCFKLYPWEFMLREEYADAIAQSGTQWLEPLWKSILSNKALLPMLWKLFPEHPNLLPAWFEWERPTTYAHKLVRKPIFSREGANISIFDAQAEPLLETTGPYGAEGFIYQAYTPMPKFADNYTLIGSWLVNDRAAGMSIREDKSEVTQDLSRFLPHIIV